MLGSSLSHSLVWFSADESHLAIESESASITIPSLRALVTVLIFPVVRPSSAKIVFSKSLN